jgi:alpha-mannosidase
MVTHFSAHVQQEGPPPLSSEEGSFIKISNPHLEFVVLKQAEDGKGWILRLRTTTGREGKTKITFPLFDVQKAYLTNGVEKNKKELPVKRHTVIVPYQSNNFTTVRLYLKPGI